MSLSDIGASCPNSQEVFRNHFRSARFDTVLRRNRDFQAQKLGLVSVQHLQVLEKHRRLVPEKRVQLVQSLLSGDFDSAQGILQETKKFAAMFAMVATPFSSLFPSPSDGPGGHLKKEMKSIAADLSDSRFLFDLKSVRDEALQPIIQDIQLLSHSLLSSSIDTTVGAMAREAAAMQREALRMTIQHEFESEEMRLQNDALKELIRKVNAFSAGPKELYVLLIFSSMSN
jgi:hypothetical protein